MRVMIAVLATGFCLGALSACAPDTVRASNDCGNRGYLPNTPGFEACYQATMARYQNAYLGMMGLGLSTLSGGR